MTTDTSERGLERLIGADRVTLAQAGRGARAPRANIGRRGEAEHSGAGN